MPWLAIDLGTTRLKLAVVNDAAQIIAHWNRPVPERQGQQHSDDWWKLVVQGIRDLEQSGHRFEAVGVSGRGGAAVLLDHDQQELVGPWSDQRHLAQQRILQGAVKDVEPYAAALLAKGMWLAHHQPELWARAAHLLYAKDVLVLRLCGRAVTDPSSGPGMQGWTTQLLEAAGAERRLLPDVALPWSLAGRLNREAAHLTGLPEGLPVGVGGHDGICANIGAEATTPSSWALTLGTHCVFRVIHPQPPATARRFYVMPPTDQVVGANALFGGRVVAWAAQLLWGGATTDAALASANRAADSVQPGSDGVRFAPWINGRIAPDMNREVRSAYRGLSLGHDRATCYRAVVEGLACTLRLNYEQMVGWCGSPERLQVTGGGAENRLLCESVAALVDRPLALVGPHAECRGAALLAMRAVNGGKAVNVPDTEHEVIEPDPRLREPCERLFADWCAQFPLDEGRYDRIDRTSGP